MVEAEQSPPYLRQPDAHLRDQDDIPATSHPSHPVPPLPNSGDEPRQDDLLTNERILRGTHAEPPTPAAHLTHVRLMNRSTCPRAPSRDSHAFLGLNAGAFPFVYFTFFPITN